MQVSERDNKRKGKGNSGRSLVHQYCCAHLFVLILKDAILGIQKKKKRYIQQIFEYVRRDLHDIDVLRCGR